MSIMPLPGQIPPMVLQSEQTVLGFLLRQSHVPDCISTILRAEHFADPVHVRIFAALCHDSAENRVPFNLLRLRAELADVLAEAGGTQYLQQFVGQPRSRADDVITEASAIAGSWAQRQRHGRSKAGEVAK